MKTEKQVIDELREFVYSKPKSYTNLLRTKRYKWLFDFIYEHKPMKLKTDNLSEMIYWIINNMEDYIKCTVCGNDIKSFASIFKGYAKHCSLYCSYHDSKQRLLTRSKESAENKRKRYEKSHNTYMSHSEDERKSFIEKTKMTKLRKYGSAVYANYEKARKTNIEKYGVDSPLKSVEIKKKIAISRATKYYNKTFLVNDYLEPFFSLTEYLEQCKIGNQLNYEFTWRCKKCGNIFKSRMDGNWFTKGIGRCYARCLKCFPILNKYLHSRMELECAKYISSLEGEQNVWSGEDKRLKSIIPKYNIDIYVPLKRIAFEFNGLRWHNTKQLNLGYHLNKTKLCEKFDIKLFHIWEDEWIKDNNSTKDRIQKMLNGIYDIDYNENITYVDRAFYNKCCLLNGFELIGETNPEIINRTNINGFSYDVEDCGKLIYQKIDMK